MKNQPQSPNRFMYVAAKTSKESERPRRRQKQKKNKAVDAYSVVETDASVAVDGGDSAKENFDPQTALTEPDYGSDASSLRTTATKVYNIFLVMKDAPGLQCTKIENKIRLRIVQNGDIILKKVFVPDADRLPGVNYFQDTNKVLAVSRVMVAWQPIGISMGVYDMCHRYLNERKQFGSPLAAFQ